MACTFSFLNQSPNLGGNSIATVTGKLFSRIQYLIIEVTGLLRYEMLQVSSMCMSC